MIDNKTIRKVIMLNKMLPGSSPTYENREAEGAVANFTTNVAMPFVSLDCEILPIQEGTGTPSPSNPRPISGTDELTLKHDNANMLVMSTFDFTIQGERFYTTNEGNVIVNGSNTSGISSVAQYWKDNLTFTLPKGTFYFKATNLSNSTITIRRKSDNYTYVQTYGTAVTFTLDEETELFIGIYIPENKSFDNVECNFMISVDNITYDVPNRETYTFDLGQEIIGGTADVVGGVGEKTQGYGKITDLATNYFYSTANKRWEVSGIPNLKSFPSRSIEGLLSDIWQPDVGAYTGDEGKIFTVNGVIYFYTSNSDTLDGNIVYPLATPTPFTFTGQPINSLLGINNVWCDTGNIKVTYKYKTGEGGSSTKKYLPIFYDLYGKGCRHL